MSDEPTIVSVDNQRGTIQGQMSGSSLIQLQGPTAAFVNISASNDVVDLLRIEPKVAALRLSLDSEPANSRLSQIDVSLEILSSLFFFQERAEVTVSALLLNGRRMVIHNPDELLIQSSNESIVSVENNFVVAEDVGTVELNVIWVVCGRILGQSIAEVTVDFNTHRPIFVEKDQNAAVIENSPIGTFIATAFAEDLDFSNTDNERRDTEYRFQDESYSYGGLFDLDRTSGVITVNGPIDRELRDSYILLIEATDRQQRLAEQALNRVVCPPSVGGSGSGSGGEGASGGVSGDGNTDCDNGMLVPDISNNTIRVDPPDTLTVSSK